jgi:hypothetical protein
MYEKNKERNKRMRVEDIKLVFTPRDQTCPYSKNHDQIKI